MAIAHPIEGTAFRMDGLPPKEQLPTQFDLPSEDPEEPGLPDEFHVYQPQLLRETFRPAACDPDQVFIGTDINLYYDPRNPLWHKRPDWFAVLGSARALRVQDLRFSYVVWQEEIAPYLVVELLSPGTEDEDLGRRLWDLDKTPGKWVVYERILKIPYHVVYSRHTGELQAFWAGVLAISTDRPAGGSAVVARGRHRSRAVGRTFCRLRGTLATLFRRRGELVVHGGRTA